MRRRRPKRTCKQQSYGQNIPDVGLQVVIRRQLDQATTNTLVSQDRFLAQVAGATGTTGNMKGVQPRTREQQIYFSLPRRPKMVFFRRHACRLRRDNLVRVYVGMQSFLDDRHEQKYLFTFSTCADIQKLVSAPASTSVMCSYALNRHHPASELRLSCKIPAAFFADL